MKAMLKILVFLLVGQSAMSQIFSKPNNSYGLIWNRGRFDSAAFLPTGCGVPSTAADLRSTDQNMMALQYDSCGHKMYLWDPKLKSWYSVSGATQLSDSTFKIGLDTIKIIGGSNITASNGASKVGNDIRLGRQLGSEESGSELLYDTEIPLNNKSLLFVSRQIPTFPYTGISKNGIDIYGDNSAGVPARFRLNDLYGGGFSITRPPTGTTINFGPSQFFVRGTDGSLILTKTPGTLPTAFHDVDGTGRYRDTLTITTMGNADSSDRAASTALLQRIAALKVDSVKRRLDSVFIYKKGSEIFAYKDSTGNAVPGGSDTQVQFNNSNVFAGDAGFTYNSTTNKISVDSLALKGPSGQGISLNRFFKNIGPSDSLVIGYGPLRPTSSGVAGSPITWSFVYAQHAVNYIDSVKGFPGGILRFYFPKNFPGYLAVTNDEVMQNGLVFSGASVGLDSADVTVSRVILTGIRIEGNGTTFVLASGNTTGWSLSYNSGTGVIGMNPASGTPWRGTDIENIQATYVGNQNYRIERVFSGLGSNNIGWRLVDNLTNTVVTGGPPNTDDIQINGLPDVGAVNVATVDSDGFNTTHYITASSNFWVLFLGKR